ncbi:hypothetical protein K525DRAFT_275695 [Schizophyllum commune Loenen D]|nr:hypothetical protein K525DRAFT_275695 [Schizophyllum commune Loenen D]
MLPGWACGVRSGVFGLIGSITRANDRAQIRLDGARVVDNLDGTSDRAHGRVAGAWLPALVVYPHSPALLLSPPPHHASLKRNKLSLPFTTPNPSA